MKRIGKARIYSQGRFEEKVIYKNPNNDFFIKIKGQTIKVYENSLGIFHYRKVDANMNNLLPYHHLSHAVADAQEKAKEAEANPDRTVENFRKG